MTVGAPPPTTASTVTDAAIEGLWADFRGQLLRPGDGGYEAARRVWNAMIDRRPALIARCAGVADVRAAVGFARAHGLLVAVRGGGHNVAGNAVCDGGLVVDLAPLKGIRVDPAARIAVAQGGVLWGELDHETQAFGLATTGGLVSTTGIAGLSLGGGFGWLQRMHGLACDNLLAADVVTADGDLARASVDEHPDLFWGLRGGGGNFGVVTAFTYRLHPIGPTVVGGLVVHPLAAARDLLRFYREATAAMPDHVTCHVALLASPDGTPVVALVPAAFGPVATGEAAVRAVRAFGAPLVDTVGPLPYRSLQTLFEDGQLAVRRHYWKSDFLRGLDDAAIDAVVDRFGQAPSPHSVVFIEQHGGAASRVEPDETAFPHRTAPYNLIVMAAWEDPAQDAANVGWARGLWEAARPFLAEAVYVNYLGEAGEEGADRVRAAYGASTYGRLAALKRRYDPGNVFRLNQNVPPAP